VNLGLPVLLAFCSPSLQAAAEAPTSMGTSGISGGSRCGSDGILRVKHGSVAVW